MMGYYLGIRVERFGDSRECYLSGFRYTATRLTTGMVLFPEVIWEDEKDNLSALGWKDRALKFEDDIHSSRNSDFLDMLVDDLNNPFLNESAKNHLYRIVRLQKVKRVSVGLELEEV